MAIHSLKYLPFVITTLLLFVLLCLYGSSIQLSVTVQNSNERRTILFSDSIVQRNVTTKKLNQQSNKDFLHKNIHDDNTSIQIIYHDLIDVNITKQNNNNNNNEGNQLSSTNSLLLNMTTNENNNNRTQQTHNNNIIVPISSKLTLNESNIRLLHIGKAGGGSYRARAKQLWKLVIDQCHPSPCDNFFSPEKSKNMTTTSNQTTKTTTKTTTTTTTTTHPSSFNVSTVITIRDPIDLFVSAFYWRTLLACHVNDTRTENPKYAGTKPNKFCKQLPEREQRVLLNTYQQNVSLLAESICNDNSTIREIATKHVSWILHLKHTLGRHWLDSNTNWFQYSNWIYPIVLEKGYDFDKQIDDSIVWLQNRTQFENNIQFEARQQNVYKRLKQSKTQSKLNSKKHSSSKQNPPLTSRGELCLRKYYSNDYMILQKLRDGTCKTKTCIHAIQSILDRRQLN